MNLSVIIGTHNPHPGRLARTLAGLRSQTLPTSQWECILVDNASSPSMSRDAHDLTNLRIVHEPEPGLTFARRCGLRAAATDLCIFADDDNVLATDYLANALRLAAAHPLVGAFGGHSLPEFETPPADWTHEFFGLLALRDLGEQPIISAAQTPVENYPLCAPIGAGMVLRREAAEVWLDAPNPGLTDRRGGELTSGGDNDIVLTIFSAGWDVAYFPELSLTHLIPTSRLDPTYLARLNRGIQKSWVQVLARHHLCPWTRIPAWTVAPRRLKAWFAYRAWSGNPAHIRWQGACGRLEGLAA